MPKYDVYRNSSDRSRKRAPFLVQVQGDYCDIPKTCVVIPLVVGSRFSPATILNPVITFNGTEYTLSTAELTATLRSNLGRPLGSVKSQSSEIMGAIDRLLL